MIVSIMQPYFFPYIGYFQLIAQSAVFVFFDAAQYVKRRWIQRNRILDNTGDPAWITLPVADASQKASIAERVYLLGSRDAKRILRRIESTYSRAPGFADVLPLIRGIMGFDDPNVATFNINLLQS